MKIKIKKTFLIFCCLGSVYSMRLLGMDNAPTSSSSIGAGNQDEKQNGEVSPFSTQESLMIWIKAYKAISANQVLTKEEKALEKKKLTIALLNNWEKVRKNELYTWFLWQLKTNGLENVARCMVER